MRGIIDRWIRNEVVAFLNAADGYEGLLSTFQDMQKLVMNSIYATSYNGLIKTQLTDLESRLPH